MPFPPNDGGAIATLNMIQGFADAGDQVTVLAMQTHKHPFSANDLPKEICEHVTWHQVWVNTRLNAIKALNNLLFSKVPYNAQRFQSEAFSQELAQILTIHSFDVIQLEGLYVNSYLPVIRAYSQALVSYRAHNVEYEIWEQLAFQEQFPLKRWYFKILAQRIKKMEIGLMPSIDLLIPITSKDAEFFPFKNKEACNVCPTGMVAQKFKLTRPVETKTLFYIGSLDWMPNQEGLLWFIERVWIDLSVKYPDWKFVIAGRQAPSDFIHKLERYPVSFLGEVADSTLFIDTFQIMVVPLLSGSGMRIKIVEAMARGKCIITTFLGAEGIDAHNFKEIIMADEPVQLAINLEKLFQNPQLIEEYGGNAFKFASNNFKNEPIINRLREFYQHKLQSINGIS
jgi:glycosyltransferase involved in cell wall biosynthesis